jgi:uncharacterized repeat protein (TIGR03847 family)
MPVFYYDPPDRFVAGSVGQPGDRTFYLQATSVGRVTSVVLEKFQVSLLAERIDELLDEVLRRTGDETEIPETAPPGLRDDGPLDLPLTEDFRAAGRPPCPLCGLPLDVSGHVCPRQNGHRAARA